MGPWWQSCVLQSCDLIEHRYAVLALSIAGCRCTNHDAQNSLATRSCVSTRRMTTWLTTLSWRASCGGCRGAMPCPAAVGSSSAALESSGPPTAVAAAPSRSEDEEQTRRFSGAPGDPLVRMHLPPRRPAQQTFSDDHVFSSFE